PQNRHLRQRAEVRQRLVRDAARVEVAGEAAGRVDAVGGHGRAVVGVAVARVDDLAGRKVPALAGLAALTAGCKIAEANPPAVRPRVDSVRTQLDLAQRALPLEHGLDQLVEARRDDQWVPRPRQL